VTQVIVEEATPRRTSDFGWKERKIHALSENIAGTADRIWVVDATPLAALQTPFKLQIEDENLSIASISGNVLTVAARGIDGTKSAAHSNGYGRIFAYSNALTRLAAPI